MTFIQLIESETRDIKESRVQARAPRSDVSVLQQTGGRCVFRVRAILDYN